jgi:alpha-glucosidase
VRRFADGAPAAEPSATPVVVDEIRVRAGETIRLDLAPSGGQALIIEPA